MSSSIAPLLINIAEQHTLRSHLSRFSKTHAVLDLIEGLHPCGLTSTGKEPIYTTIGGHRSIVRTYSIKLGIGARLALQAELMLGDYSVEFNKSGLDRPFLQIKTNVKPSIEEMDDLAQRLTKNSPHKQRLIEKMAQHGHTFIPAGVILDASEQNKAPSVPDQKASQALNREESDKSAQPQAAPAARPKEKENQPNNKVLAISRGRGSGLGL